MNQNSNDAPSVGLAILGFLIPVVGAITWLVMRAEKPLQAKSAGQGALIGFGLQVVMTVLLLSVAGNNLANSPEFQKAKAAQVAPR